MKYYWNFREELAEAISDKVAILEAIAITIIFFCACLLVNFEVVAPNWVRVLLLLISMIAIAAVFVISRLAVSSINCISKRNEGIAEYVAEFLITRKFVVGERSQID